MRRRPSEPQGYNEAIDACIREATKVLVRAVQECDRAGLSKERRVFGPLQAAMTLLRQAQKHGAHMPKVQAEPEVRVAKEKSPSKERPKVKPKDGKS